MSANKTTKREKGKNWKKLTLNSRISPPWKRYDYLLLFLLFRSVSCEERSLFSLVFLSFVRPTKDTHRHPISFSSLWYTNIYTYRRTTTPTTTRPTNPPLRARVPRVKRAHLAKATRRVKERKRNTKCGSKRRKSERAREDLPPKDREKKKRISSLFHHHPKIACATTYYFVPWRTRSSTSVFFWRRVVVVWAGVNPKRIKCRPLFYVLCYACVMIGECWYEGWWEQMVSFVRSLSFFE